MSREHHPRLSPGARRPSSGHDLDAGRHLTRLSRSPLAHELQVEHFPSQQFTLFAKVDMSACSSLRERASRTGRAPTYNDVFVRACAVALTSFPTLNATYERHRVVLQDHIDVAIVIATDGRQASAAVQDADLLSLERVSRETRRLGEASWEGQLPPAADSRPATFTVTNLGMYGVSRFSAYVPPRQAAILSVGAIAPQPVVTEGGTIAAAPLAEIGLTCDHRIVSAADAAFFLERVTQLVTDEVDDL
jgi:pyruvate dehydrogenase E2 component (dihydrolipoamide acetyltransferase)